VRFLIVLGLVACGGAAGPGGSFPDELPACAAPIPVAAACPGGIWGWAGDARSGAPVAGVTVTARVGDTERQARTGADGRYGLCDLGTGEWEVTLAIDDAELVLPATIPHDGARVVAVRVDRASERDTRPQAAGLPAGAEYRNVVAARLERCRL
jgi:hypothetical protein